MKWPWSREPTRQESAEPVSDDLEEATRARLRAEAALRFEKRRSGEIKKETSRSQRFRRTNHFVELILETFERPPQ